MSAYDPKRTRRAFPSASLSRYDAVSCGKWLELLKAKAARTPAVPAAHRTRKAASRVATACRHSQPLAARLGSRRRTVCRQSAPRNDRRRSLTFSHRGFANASTDANGKNNRTNCNPGIFSWGPLLCEHLARGVCTARQIPCGCISATYSQLRLGPNAIPLAD